LYDLGFRSVAYLQSAVCTPKFDDRLAGFEEILQKLGMACEMRLPLPPTLTGAYAEMKAWLEKAQPLPLAVCADTDDIALGAMKALQEMGCRIPEDLSIIGAGNVEFGVMSNPPLTTINLSASQIGVVTLRLMMKKLKDEATFGNMEHIAVQGRLVLRGSTRARQPFV
jgi:LacI family transcriptional regulator